MAGHDPQDPSSCALPGDDYPGALPGYQGPPRIGLVRDFFYGHAQEEVWRHTDGVVERLRQAGATVQEVKLPESFQNHEAARSVVQQVEAAAFHKRMFTENPDAYRPMLRRNIEIGMLIPGVHYLQAQRVRRKFRSDIAAVLANVDILLTPATPSSAPRDLTTTGPPLFQGPWTSSGLPAVAIPSGLDSSGMPLGIQLAGAPFEEARLLAVARWCEAVLGVTPVPPCME